MLIVRIGLHENKIIFVILLLGENKQWLHSYCSLKFVTDLALCNSLSDQSTSSIFSKERFWTENLLIGFVQAQL